MLCCAIGCHKEAEYKIEAQRPDGSPAGPDPYSDDTFACEEHVGHLLGWQDKATDTHEIVWLISQYINAPNKSGIVED